MHRLSRRTFLRGVAALGAASAAGPLLAACGVEERAPEASPTSAASPTTPSMAPSPTPTAEGGTKMARIAFVKADDRREGVLRAVRLLNPDSLGGRVFIKPNFNSADPSPGSTHPETLRAVVETAKDLGATEITVGDRSGWGTGGREPTRENMAALGVLDMAKEMGFEALDFDSLGVNGWRKVEFEGSHWPQGFYVPRILSEVDSVVSTCNLKTHQTGHFTLSLKLSVGLVPLQLQYHNYMRDLHFGEGGQNRDHRYMIAEINTAYEPELIVMDGLVAFTTGGPATGTRVDTEVFLAGTDRVALDAVGVALLRHWGTTPEVSEGPIFEQEQIARAVELGLGISSPREIELVTEDEESAFYAAEVRAVLDRGVGLPDMS